MYGFGGDRQTAAVVVAPSDEKGESGEPKLNRPLFTKRAAGWRRALTTATTTVWPQPTMWGGHARCLGLASALDLKYSCVMWPVYMRRHCSSLESPITANDHDG